MESELELRLRAKTSMIWMATLEEDRSVPRIQAVAEKLGYIVFNWDCLQGFSLLSPSKVRQPAEGHCTHVDQALNAMGSYSHHRAVFIARDFALLIPRMEPSPEYVGLVRRVKELYRALRHSEYVIVFLSRSPSVPAELEACMALIEVRLPAPEERQGIIKAWVQANCAGISCEISDEDFHRLATASGGMSSQQIQAALRLSVTKRKGLVRGASEDMLAEKAAAVRKSEILQCVETTTTLDDVGGLESIKDWLRKRASAFSSAGGRYGLRKQKGVVVVGPPGTGKSMLAKGTASMLGMSLLQLDLGRVYGSLVGQSEERIRFALALAESQAPCIVWLDEIDKQTAGASGPSGDGGTTQRVTSCLLNWLQERPAPVFVFATANRIDRGLPELIRAERFDERFFVDLPAPAERRAILNVILHRHNLDPKELTSDDLVRMTDRFSGAELEATVNEAMFEAFYDSQRPVTVKDIEAATARIVPLADQMRDQIEETRNWGRSCARSAA